MLDDASTKYTYATTESSILGRLLSSRLSATVCCGTVPVRLFQSIASYLLTAPNIIAVSPIPVNYIIYYVYEYVFLLAANYPNGIYLLMTMYAFPELFIFFFLIALLIRFIETTGPLQSTPAKYPQRKYSCMLFLVHFFFRFEQIGSLRGKSQSYSIKTPTKAYNI